MATRLNRNAAKNLFVGQRVETDYSPGVYVIDRLIKSEPGKPFMDGLGAVVSPAVTTCDKCGSTKPTAKPLVVIRDGFAAGWFWPEGILEFVKDGTGY